MSRLGQGLVGVARFFYNFVVGDDWRVAAVMLLALVATAGLVAARLNPCWLVPVLAVVMTWFSLRRRATT